MRQSGEQGETTRISRRKTFLYGVLPQDRTKIRYFSHYVILQCILVVIGAATVLQCVWKPEDGIFEIDTLARIMYLYDTNKCGSMRSIKQFRDLHLNNETYGLPIRPIAHEPVYLHVLTKLSGKFRSHMIFSLSIHGTWACAALILLAFSTIKDLKVLKIILKIFLYVSYMCVLFDIVMAIIYVTHIQQSLTKAMIIRYSGFGMVPSKVSNPEEFGGWLPLIASCAWLRGGVFLFLNMYMCRFINRLINKIHGKEVKSRLRSGYNVPLPEANYNHKVSHGALYYRAYNKL